MTGTAVEGRYLDLTGTLPPHAAIVARLAPEIVDEGRNGLIVPPADAAAVARCIRQLLGDPALRRRLGAAMESTGEDAAGASPVLS